MKIFDKIHRNFVFLKNRIAGGLFELVFDFHKIPKKTVLLVELNSARTEVIPSFAKYFKDLGYNVEVIVTPCPQNFLPKLDVEKVYYFTPSRAKVVLRRNKIRKYELVAFTSWRLNIKSPTGEASSTVADHINIKNVKSKLGSVFVHHFGEDNALTPHRAIALSDVTRDGAYAVNPCWFGEMNVKDKNKKVKFIVAGRLEPDKKNLKLLFDTSRELVKTGIRNFEVQIYGYNSKAIIPPDLKAYIKSKEIGSFKTLYKEFSSADFFLPLLDSSNDEHKISMAGATPGSFQLIRGFLLPPVIEAYFANLHSFKETTAIVYNLPEEFLGAMTRAIQTENEEYRTICKNLLQQKKEIEQRSVENLSDLIKDLQEQTVDCKIKDN